MTTGEFFLTVLITLIIIFIFAYIIWRFIVAHRASNTGGPCNTDDDCVAGNYCGGGNICVRGSSGKKQGAVCMASTDCEVGLLCTQDSSGVNRCTPVLRNRVVVV